MTTLISFLGGGKRGGSYQTTDYKFSHGTVYENERYFGMVLTKEVKPDRLILLGTSASMWDVFFVAGLEDHIEAWSTLSDAVQSDSVTIEQLQPFEQFLTDELGLQVTCQLIDYAKESAGQIDILKKLDELLVKDEHVVMDVTHGFRHLPLIALVAARYLQVTKNVHIEHIYYGLYSNELKFSEVLELRGLLDMLNWVSALETFDKDGDYAVFAPLLVNVGLDQQSADELERASYLERILNASAASAKLKQVMPKLDELHKTDSPLFSLFYTPLAKRLSWYKKTSLGLQEQDLAEKYFKRKDYVRAVIYAMEGLISRETALNEDDVQSFKARKEAYEYLVDSREDFKIFKEFRNAMVHGTASGKDRIRQIMKDPERLHASLKDRFKQLFKDLS
ncbi:CRISPR-associated Csx2 family protein [Psychrobacter luti]|uniref:CRISPR-associated Csx2 family protein n=1 Tax=Psychrobacter luti TaxID=198481 RepID=A0A839TAI1_9GAMM|nr:TIGR02221 family CRISPR-associated protein [Psychrobacter luti]MBB3106138.1 CRISPR-associated Csx2 family protein [Psychrobacter luti]